MHRIDFQPEMVGRERELNELEERLDRATKGNGSTLLISGEAGIGKTRLVDELKNVAVSKGFKILSGNSLYESLTPYMPFMDALKSGDMDNLFAEAAPKVEAVYLVTDTGLLIKEALREETELDPDMFTAMLTTVGDFVKDSLSMLNGKEKKGALNILGYENYRIIIEYRKQTNLVAILTGIENEFLINDIKQMLVKINNQYGNVLKGWDGSDTSIEGIEKLLQPLITSGKYDGIYYGKGNPRARRNLLFENVSMGLIRLAAQKPTLICIEDLQWADPSSLALMHYVARNTKRSGLVLLGTYRPEDVAVKEGMKHPLLEMMQLMNREDLYQPIELQRLSEENILIVIQSLFGEIELSEKFKNRIFKETEGNPLFVIELLKLLVDEKIIDRDNGTWKLVKSIEDVDIPSKIYDVITRRVDRVGKEQRKILDYVSIIGNEFTSELLSSVLDIPRVKLLEDMRTLEQKHRLIHSSNGSFRFDHSKIREVLYGEIPKELKMEYHGLIANSIETLNKDDLDAVTVDLAYHYYQAKNKDKALPNLIKAAEKARKQFSNEEGIGFYMDALELEDDAKKRFEIYEALGDILKLIGNYDDAIVSFVKALELTDDKDKKAEIRARIGNVHNHRGEYNKAIEICSKALAEIKSEGYRSEILVLVTMGEANSGLGEYAKALENQEESLELSEKVGDQQGRIFALRNIGNIRAFHGDYDGFLAYQEKVLEIEEETGDLLGLAGSYNSIGIVHFYKGDYEKALDYYHKSLAIREKTGDQYGRATSLTNVAAVLQTIGDYENAIEYYEKTVELCEKIGKQTGYVIALCGIGQTYFKKGDNDKALVYYKKSLEISKNIGHQRNNIFCCWGIAEIHIKEGDLASALDCVTQMFDISKAIGSKDLIAASKKTFGMIYREQKKWKESIENFGESIEVFEEAGTKSQLAESHYEFGLMWKKKGDLEKAKKQLNKALHIFEKLKLEYKIRNLKALIKSL